VSLDGIERAKHRENVNADQSSKRIEKCANRIERNRCAFDRFEGLRKRLFTEEKGQKKGNKDQM
jgi:hypothetical protein